MVYWLNGEYWDDLLYAYYTHLGDYFVDYEISFQDFVNMYCAHSGI